MIEFILNHKKIVTHTDPASPLVDIIRKNHFMGTKIGCREGDCGACSVIIGKLQANGEIDYRSVTSCIMPVRNVHGCHVITIEGISSDENPIQHAMQAFHATQCGFCTPGFVMALTAATLERTKTKQHTYTLLDAVDGNICRCTGYKSIQRAITSLEEKLFADQKIEICDLAAKNIIPTDFLQIKQRLAQIAPYIAPAAQHGDRIIAQGTDLLVQNPKGIEQNKVFVADLAIPNNIESNGKTLRIGAAMTCTEFMENDHIIKLWPKLPEQLRLVSSTPIRNMGTIAGNFANASPIGDLSQIFLALDAQLILRKDDTTRTVPLRQFFLQYKKVDLQKGEYIQEIQIELNANRLNFQKVSKRKKLDIASITSAISFIATDNQITRADATMGGVAAIPLFLKKTSQFLQGKDFSVKTLQQANEVMQSEIQPISDIRGSESYKRLLARNVFFSHFIELLPNQFAVEDLI